MREKPIGILDSGVGGLTVVKEIFRQLPKEEVIYFGDTARCPYGPRSTEEVRKFTTEICNFLMRFDVKMIVIACNTATAAALEDIKRMVDIPVIGVIHPGSLAAIKNTKTGRIGVIGTEGTIKSEKYVDTLKGINPDLWIESQACPTLVPLVESGIEDEQMIRQEVKLALEPIADKEIDSLILGCTHYPLISDYIQEVMGEQVSILSSAEETAREVSSILHYQGIIASNEYTPNHQFFTTSDIQQFKRIADKWLGEKIDVKYVDLSEITQS